MIAPISPMLDVSVMALKPSADRKTQARPSQKNTFGLLPGRESGHGTCPDATTGKGGCCEVRPGRKLATCYVEPLMKAYPSVYAVLAHNTYLLRHATEDQQTTLLAKEFARFRKLELTKPEPWLHYRLHWSGDVFSAQYARALRAAMAQFPDIGFWGYTRSFTSVPEVLELLGELDNCQLYLSLDPDNMEAGHAAWFAHLERFPETRVRLAYMGRTSAEYQEEFERARGDRTWKKPEMQLCPELQGRLPLQGACHACQKCLGTRRTPVSILFAT